MVLQSSHHHPFAAVHTASAARCRRVLVILVGLLLAASAHVFAADVDPQPVRTDRQVQSTVRLEDLLDDAYADNPSIRKAREAWRTTVENYRVSTGYPDPQVMVTWFSQPIETRLGPQEWSAQISQQIPFPGKMSKVGELVAADARIARLNLDKAVKETLLAVKASYFELWYIRQAKAITRQNTELLQHIRKIVETAHADDRTTLTDVIKAQS
ncbi:MAG: TolC family protein, partial [Desulfatitalea sp.]|nr:TolC family protein [Desulfatitalea sp.]NNK02752.1 TolC family protein [Desulfatitalea sp.]